MVFRLISNCPRKSSLVLHVCPFPCITQLLTWTGTLHTEWGDPLYRFRESYTILQRSKTIYGSGPTAQHRGRRRREAPSQLPDSPANFGHQSYAFLLAQANSNNVLSSTEVKDNDITDWTKLPRDGWTSVPQKTVSIVRSLDETAVNVISVSTFPFDSRWNHETRRSPGTIPHGCTW